MPETQDRRDAEKARSMQNATNAPDLTPESPDGQKAVQAYADRLDALLDDREDVGTDIKALKKEMTEHGYNAALINKGVAARRKRAKAEKEEFERRKAEIALYFTIILDDDAVQP